jgi:hypothetical protein
MNTPDSEPFNCVDFEKQLEERKFVVVEKILEPEGRRSPLGFINGIYKTPSYQAQTLQFRLAPQSPINPLDVDALNRFADLLPKETYSKSEREVNPDLPKYKPLDGIFRVSPVSSYAEFGTREPMIRLFLAHHHYREHLANYNVGSQFTVDYEDSDQAVLDEIGLVSKSVKNPGVISGEVYRFVRVWLYPNTEIAERVITSTTVRNVEPYIPIERLKDYINSDEYLNFY